MDSWPLLGRLKRAVKKVRFLLSYRANRWRLASMISRTKTRRLSFNDRPGLLMTAYDEADHGGGGGGQSGSFERARSLQRTMSYPSEEEDVDKRAELFIANFYRQLRMERQVSLELRYCRESSFGSATSP